MSITSSGTLALHAGAVEHWNRDGEIAYSITGGDVRDVTPVGDRWEHYRWTARFRFQGRTLQVGFMQGMGLPGVPDAARILASAFEDADSVAWDDFYGWAGNMGYSTDDPDDQRRARRIYNACERMDARLDRFFGSRRAEWAEALESVR